MKTQMKLEVRENITIVGFYLFVGIIVFTAITEMITVGEAIIGLLLAAIYQK